MTPERNKPCPCGSGKKFKRCCWLAPPQPDPNKTRALTADEAVEHAARRRRMLGYLLAATSVMP